MLDASIAEPTRVSRCVLLYLTLPCRSFILTQIDLITLIPETPLELRPIVKSKLLVVLIDHYVIFCPMPTEIIAQIGIFVIREIVSLCLSWTETTEIIVAFTMVVLAGGIVLSFRHDTQTELRLDDLLE